MEGAGRWSLIRNTEKENEEKNHHHQKRREKIAGIVPTRLWCGF